ncbi:hypothetical protein AKO1_001615 [Acrasis kona]|uniref:Potassium channel tetramerisation-type BTB domain-containing protein n=1 Tax=Acrasis kona TaxID=1008807 RepID=A0AAW2ZA31_9EUKA
MDVDVEDVVTKKLTLEDLLEAAQIEIIRLNVGGRLYTTTKRILTSQKNSFFSGALNNPFFQENEQTLVIDRPTNDFDVILAGMRGEDVEDIIDGFNEHRRDVLWDDIKFYCLDDTFSKCFRDKLRAERLLDPTNYFATDGRYHEVVSDFRSMISSLIQIDHGKIATGHEDGSIRIWRITSRCTLIAKLEGHSEDVWSLQKLKDGRLVSVGGNVKIWDIKKTKCDLELTDSKGSITSVFMVDDRKLCSVSCVHSIKIWDVDSGRCDTDIKVTGCEIAAFKGNKFYVSLGDNKIACVFSSSKIKIFNTATEYCVQTIDTLFTDITKLFKLTDGRLATLGVTGVLPQIKIWNTNGQCDLIIECHELLNDVVQLRNGNIAGFAGSQVHIYYTLSGEYSNFTFILPSESNEYEDDINFEITTLLQLDDNTLMGITSDGGIQVWDIEQGDIDLKLMLDGHTSNFYAQAIQLEDGRLVSFDTRKFCIWSYPYA